jgi:hypothetical protein
MATRSSRRAGYAIAIALNIGFLVIAVNLVSWDWFPWLTEEFNDVVPYIVASVAASIAVNAAYLWYDPPWFKSLAELGALALSLVATVRMLQVFPFDFSNYDFAWGALVRWILGVAIFGMAIGMIAHLAKLIRFGRDALEEGFEG